MVLTLLAVSLVVFIVWYGRRARRRKNGPNGYRSSWRASFQSLQSQFTRPPSVRPDVRDSTYSFGAHTTNRHDRELEAGGVDRNTSVRSVMTLPTYSAVPRENEGVIGREGERAGMDTVVEFPETLDEDESRRDAEMESLYQIRLQRRQEAAERRERRDQRRQARDRGDFETLTRLRQEEAARERQREEEGSAAAMVRHHEGQSRDRRVSAVSYGDLGVARHDGSRVRANSNESDRPLLDTAESFGMSGPVRPWLSGESLGMHHRGRSSTTNLSVTSFGSDDHSGFDDDGSDFESIQLQQTHSRPQSSTRSRAHSRAVSGTRSRATSFGQPLTLTTTDLGDAIIPPEPPHYDTTDFEEAPPYTSPVRTRVTDVALHDTTTPLGDAPPYTSPVRTVPAEIAQPPSAASARGVPQLPAFERLPSIRINPSTPIEPRQRDFPNF